MILELIKPHELQKPIIDACLQPELFFIVAVLGRQWRFGKTTLAENLAIYWAINNSDRIIYWVSPTDAQSQKVYKEIVHAIVESGVIRSKKEPRGNTEIVFKNNSKMNKKKVFKLCEKLHMSVHQSKLFKPCGPFFLVKKNPRSRFQKKTS